MHGRSLPARPQGCDITAADYRKFRPASSGRSPRLLRPADPPSGTGPLQAFLGNSGSITSRVTVCDKSETPSEPVLRSFNASGF